MTEKREDRRTQYSKRVIREALYELMQKKPLNKISVTELCALADVNRSTFYAYYNDIFDLHEKITKEFYTIQRRHINFAASFLRERGDITRLSVADFQVVSRSYLSVVKENKSLYRFVFNTNASRAVLTSIDKVYFHELSRDMAEPLKTIFRRSFSFVSGGTASLIVDWLENDCADPMEPLSRALAYFYNGVFNGQNFVKR